MIPPERVSKCRLFLDYMRREGNIREREYAEDIVAIIDDHSVLKAEVKRLNTWHSTLSEAWKTRAEKTEAQLEKAKSDLIDESKRRAAIAKSLQAHQDQLAKQAPLIEAVMGATLYDSEAPGVTMLEFGEQAEWDILRAALALREEKK